MIREIVEIDMPLSERGERLAELETRQRDLWQMMREEAMAADRELMRV